MLGSNAARPLGMSPARIVTYSALASHRFSQWMWGRPYTLMHMHRFLFLTPQLLLTNTPSSATSAKIGSNPGSGDGLSSSSSSARELHTSNSCASSAVLPLQTQAVPEILLPTDLYPPSPSSGYSLSGSSAAVSSSTLEETPCINPSPSTGTILEAAGAKNAIAFNYLLAASWYPKSRQRYHPHLHHPHHPHHHHHALQQQQQRLEEAANAQRELRWKEKLRAAHPGKVDAGEDAFFHISTPNRVALGVADGVGGWSEMGVDPAQFSWALMNNAEDIARLTDSTLSESKDISNPTLAAGGENQVLDAQTILDGAYSELIQSGAVEAGSSTACILSLCKITGVLRASNLGDSAFLLIRDNRCIYESPSQQHFWNCPYQLTVLPPRLQQQQSTNAKVDSSSDSDSTASNSTSSTSGQRISKPATAKCSANNSSDKKKKYVQDSPKDALQSMHQLQDGDVIVLATDGLWDNVFTKEAVELVDRELGDIIREQRSRNDFPSREMEEMSREQHLSAEEILARVRALSKRLTNTARRFSLDTKRLTPFSQGARHIQCGGKVDDITVIVTLVRSTGPRS